MPLKSRAGSLCSNLARHNHPRRFKRKPVMHSLPSILRQGLILLIGCTFFTVGRSEPFIPATDDTIVERLPSAYRAGKERLQTLRNQLAEDPQNSQRVAALAEEYIRLAQADADPRYYGYAESVLSPWQDEFHPPIEILRQRAALHQVRQQGGLALSDLEQLLARQPGDARAWLDSAGILQARGEYAEARRSCERLIGLAEPLISAVCSSYVLSLQGQAAKSYQLLTKIMRATPQASPAARQWALSVQAQIAARLGDAAQAKRHFQEALKLGPSDKQLLATYADFLLDQQQVAAVRELLADEITDESLLLRLALAEKQLGGTRLNEYKTTLKSRFDAARLRGDSAHWRDQGRALLALFDQPAAALALAKQLWVSQKEPADARLLLESALAANQPQAAQPVLEWLDDTGLEDVHLALLAARFR